MDDAVYTNERIIEILERVLVELEAISARQDELAAALDRPRTRGNN